MPRRLFWQLFSSFFLITLAALVAVIWFSSRALHRFHFEQRTGDVQARAQLVQQRLAAVLSSGDTASVDAICKDLGGRTGTRFTCILPSGRVVGDSDEDPSRMDNHGQRPEIAEALLGRTGVSTRYSITVHKTMLYVALPLKIDGDIRGVVRASVPVMSVRETLRDVRDEIVLGGLVIAMLVGMASLAVSRRLSRPLEEMRAGAERYAQGHLEHRLPVPRSFEMFRLAEAMNQMAAQLEARMRETIRERNEREAILSSMVEGVLAVDTSERIIILNEAAARLFDVTVEDAHGRSIQEVVRNMEIQRHVSRTLKQQESVEANVALTGRQERYLQLHATVLRDAQGESIGALIVLNDITQLRKAESLRRDFVANVSHELKTPVTSIKGFVETLLDGAIENQSDARRFLERTAHQADRLSQIIDDLISLSRIEKDTEQEGIELEHTGVRGVLQSAIQACEVTASAKAVRIDLTCDENLTAPMDPPMLELAVVNLLDNAIKYSDTGRSVEVLADQTDGELTISVLDHGCGIAPEHLPRVFERFYRADKGRSRELGGTGLGLAIVKHIALAHKGRVAVESQVDKGSKFTIRLPMKPTPRAT